MELQAAIDLRTIDDAIGLMKEIHPYIDIIEVGSWLGLIEGFSALGKMKAAFPEKKVLADCKIVDGGYPIAATALEAGADIVTTIAITDDGNLKGVVAAAHERGKLAMCDTINCQNLYERVVELDAMGFDYILLHTPHESDYVSAPISAIAKCKSLVKNAKIGISGGIVPEYMPEIVAQNPDLVVVGGALYNAKNPKETAEKFRSYMDK